MSDVVVLFTDGTRKNFKATNFKHSDIHACYYIKCESGNHVIITDNCVKAIGYKEDMGND